MDTDKLLSQLTQWLLAEGPENDIVISSRIRLARNVAGFPFLSRATEHDRRSIRDTVKNAAGELWNEKDYDFIEVDTLEQIDREFLLERQLISRELVEMDGTRAAVVDRREMFCIMVNEEDHLRIHGMTSGFDPGKVWKRINELDNQLESKLDYAFHQKYGFLTACPTNVGTGMRVSVMIHLPALVVTKEIDKVFRSLQKVNLAVRGLYGEGSQSFGDFYQISNQMTLGKTEEQLIEKVCDLIPQIVAYERQARDFLLKERRDIILDRCSRAMGLLQTARTIGSVEAMHHLSSVRLGVNIGLLEKPDISVVNHLLLNTQPAHLQKLHKTELDHEHRDIERANYLRQRLASSL